MNIVYDKSLKLFMLSPSSWTAIGPTQWFDNYKLISSLESVHSKDLGVIYIGDYLRATETLPAKTIDIANSPAFSRLVRDLDMEDWYLLMNRSNFNITWKKLLSNDSVVALQYENKVWFRERFSNKLNFPNHVIYTFDQMRGLTFSYLAEKLSSQKLVVQHPSLTGGRGTYYVQSDTELKNFYNDFKNQIEKDTKIVISEKINSSIERTIQCCVTENDIFVGPPQSQMIGNLQLIDSGSGSIKFCGGRIDNGLLSSAQYHIAYSTAQLVGESLKSLGYRGIFGIDFLINGEQVYVLEVNPRMTALTTLLAFLQTNTPFLLLHILEQAGVEYAISEDSNSPEGISGGSFVVVYAQEDLCTDFKTGLYDAQANRIGDGLEYGNIIPKKHDEYFVAMKVSPNKPVSKGKSLAFIYSRDQLFSDSGQLNINLDILLSRIRGS